METISSLQVVIKTYEKWILSKEKLASNNFQQKEIRKCLEFEINQFWKIFIRSNQKKLMKHLFDLLDQETSTSLMEKPQEKHKAAQMIIARVEKMITTYNYKSINYAVRDLSIIYEKHKLAITKNFENEHLERLLLEYVLNLIELSIKISDPNQYFRKFIIDHYDELILRIRKKYPSENAINLLQEVYKILTTRNKDKLPPSNVKEQIITYILQACKFIILSAAKKKKENKKFLVI